MQGTPILQIEDFRMCFNGPDGPVHAVRDVNLCVRSGEVVALVGESGSGKTALCRAVLALHTGHARYLSGQILLMGRDVLSCDESEMQQIRGSVAAMVFQDPLSSLNPVYTVGEQLALPLRQHYGIRDKAELRLRSENLLGESELLGKYPGELSGGQRQRVTLALALACDPRLIIADEPTTALDADAGWRVMDAFRSLAKTRDKGVLFVTHDISLAKRIADRIFVMYRGQIVESGTRDEVLQNPKHEYTKRLLRSSDFSQEFKSASEPMRCGNGVFEGKTREPEILMQTENLAFQYPGQGQCVFRHIGFSIRRGEILGLVGESGCGKTTLAKLLCGLLRPSDGRIYGWKPLGNTSRKDSVNVQMIFQDSAAAFNERMKVREILAEPLTIRRRPASEKASRVEEVAARVGLAPELLERHPYELSGGQRQRASLARALIQDPDFLIADEPVSSLDAPVQAEILQLLRSIRSGRRIREGEGSQALCEERADHMLTILIIGHNVPQLQRACDRVLELRADKIREIRGRDNGEYDRKDDREFY